MHMRTDATARGGSAGPVAIGTEEGIAEDRAGNATVRILLVPGFVADTFSEIERSYVELCSDPPDDLEFLWLVPEISSKYSTFAKAQSRGSLKEPAYVPYLRAHNIPYIVGTISKYDPVANFLLFRRIFARHRIDAVYTHFGYERFWATFLGKLCGKATIWNEHWHSLGRRHALLKRCFYRLFVDEFISVSRFITATLPPRSRVHTVRNAIRAEPPTRPDALQRREQRARFGIAREATVVLMVAAFRAEKRHFLALQICARALQTRKDIVFVFPGSGGLRDAFLREVHERGLDEHVFAPGHIDDVNDCYAMADIAILTSLDEPFGYVLLEAMRYGLPVIAFDSGGPSEVIKNGETGFLIPEGNVDEFSQKLLALIGDAGAKGAMGERAARVVRDEYRRDVWAKTLNMILHRVGRDHRRSRSSSDS